MLLAQKLLLLDQVYTLYDQYIGTVDSACRATCSDCCTCNVTLTTLEAHLMLKALPADQWPRVEKIIDAQMGKPRFAPEATFNRIADFCAAGMEPPKEAIDASWGPCPLLTDRLCPFYAARPFGCRCLVSSTPCSQTGAAEMSEFTATVNTLFLQVIEHIDQDGFSGNLSDMMVHVMAAETRRSVPLQSIQPRLIPNAPLRILMIPSEHKDRVRPVLEQIRALAI